MSCSNCFNGCTEITSDKCVRYTGADIPELGIQNGDTLLFVEQALAQFIISALDGTGITPVIDPSIICNAVTVNLPTSGNLTLIDIISGLVKSICDLQEQIDTIIVDVTEINNVLAELNAFYNIPSSCFATGVTINPLSTHSVLQALLDTFCALSISLPTTYVLQSELNSEVVAILENEGIIGPVTKEYTKMVPYVAYPFFPTTEILSNFTLSGAGIPGSPYENIYFCNGVNFGVPDLRGLVLAGVTDGMGGATLQPDVNPSNPFNPDYALGTRTGTNFVTLGVDQMPNHNHPFSSVDIVDPGHVHIVTGSNAESGDAGPYFTTSPGEPNGDKTVGTQIPDITGITAELNIEGQGNNLPHQNNQPTIGCYYIMYIPAP